MPLLQVSFRRDFDENLSQEEIKKQISLCEIFLRHAVARVIQIARTGVDKPDVKPLELGKITINKGLMGVYKFDAVLLFNMHSLEFNPDADTIKNGDKSEIRVYPHLNGFFSEHPKRTEIIRLGDPIPGTLIRLLSVDLTSLYDDSEWNPAL